jgi:anaerobic selenocysteine-containing dehydrogenase
MVGFVREGRLVRVESNKLSSYAGICARGRAATGALYNPDRIKTPLIRVGERGEGKFRRATWEEVIDLVSSKMKALRDSGDEKLLAFLPRFNSAAGLDKHFYSVYGTPNNVGYGDTCFGNALSVSLGAVLGGSLSGGVPTQGTSTFSSDYENAEYGVLIGRNPGGGLVTFPWGVMFGRGKANGMKLTVIDPRKPSEAGESDSDWLPIRPGTDAAFLAAIVSEILNKKYYDESYLKKYTNTDMLVYSDTGLPLGEQKEKVFDYMVYDAEISGFRLKSEAVSPVMMGTYEYEGKVVKTALQAMTDSSKDFTPAWAEAVCGVPAKDIEDVAAKLNAHKPKVFVDRGYRSERYANSLRAKTLIAVINVLVGCIGVKGGIALQHKVALGKAFHSPKVKGDSIMKEWMAKESGYLFGSTGHYRRTYFRSLLEGFPYVSKMAVIDGQNVIGGSAAGDKIAEAMEKLETIVVIAPFMNETTLYADVIIPSTLFMERDEPLVSKWKAPFPVIGVNRKAVDPLYGIMDTYDLYLAIAKKVFTPEEYAMYFAEFEEKGMRMVWEKEYAGIKGISDEEKATIPSLDVLLETGLWSTDEIHYKPKSKGTPSGFMEPYSIYLAESYNKLKADGYEYAEHANPLPIYNEPFWMEKKSELSGDEFIPITGFSPMNSFTGGQTKNNPLLTQFADALELGAVYINAEKGRKMGLKDGDDVEVFNIEKPELVTVSKVKLSELVQPDTLFTYYGMTAGYFKGYASGLRYAMKDGFNPNHVADFKFNPLTAGHPAQDFIVKVRRAAS